MELGNLFGSKTQSPPPETFLAIQIQEDLIKTAVWQIDDGLPKVVSFGPMLPWSDTDSLLTAVDNSLADSLKDSPLEPNRVIFGLPENWIKENKIAPEFSPHIKNLLDKLELKAVGFVVITEAIIQHLKTMEGIPPTAIILELSLSKANVVVVRLGKVIGREEVARSEDLAKDVAEGLTRMELDQLPARFLIINGSDVEAEQQLSSYSWQDDLSFLHLPKVEIPDPHFSIEAIAVSGGSEAARSMGIDVTPATITPEVPAESPITMEEPLTESPEEELASAQDFGFGSGDDTLEEPIESVEAVETIEQDGILPVKKNKPSFKQFIPSLKNISLPPLSLSFVNNLSPANLKLPIIAVVVALVLLSPLGVFAFYNVFGKANIEVSVTPQDLTKTFTVALGSTSDTSLPNLQATTDTLEVEETQSVPTTGEAVVGDKAKGEVTIYNRTDTVKKLPKGTVLTTSSNLKFVLDEEVNVASKSAGTIDANGNEVTPLGKATVSATAYSIGTDSNIASNTSLSIASFLVSSIEGKSGNFSGGTSRTVQAVSKQDQERLLSALTEALKSKATEQINSSSSDEKVIALDDLKISAKEFDKNVGEEASNLSLTLKAQVPLLRYQQKQLEELILSQVTQAVPAGYSFNPSLAQVNVSTPKSDDDSVTADATITARLLPSINVEDYVKKLSGKSFTSAKNLLETIPGFEKVKFAISPAIPIFSKRLSMNSKNLVLTIQPITP